MKLLSLMFLTLVLTITATAADVTGKWSGTFAVTNPDGSAGEPNPAVMILKQTGSTISGTAGTSEAEQFPIDNAKIDGNKISGTVNPNDGATYVVTMTVNGDRMAGELTVTQGGQTIKGKIELKRG
jgi:hypothetical protein